MVLLPSRYALLARSLPAHAYLLLFFSSKRWRCLANRHKCIDIERQRRRGGGDE